jgi:hypothetical protein
MRRKATAADRRLERKLTGQQRSIRRHHELLRYAHAIRERFPGVVSITIQHASKIDFPSPVYDEPVRETRTYGPEDPALFWHACVSRDCIEGSGAKSGHDLTEEILGAIRAREAVIEGRSVCMGWQDASRIGQHRCLTTDTFRAQITYA